MDSIEARLAKIEKELLEIRRELSRRTNWVFRQSDRFRGDDDLKEIFRLGSEIRNANRSEFE